VGAGSANPDGFDGIVEHDAGDDDMDVDRGFSPAQTLGAIRWRRLRSAAEMLARWVPGFQWDPNSLSIGIVGPDDSKQVRELKVRDSSVLPCPFDADQNDTFRLDAGIGVAYAHVAARFTSMTSSTDTCTGASHPEILSATSTTAQSLSWVHHSHRGHQYPSLVSLRRSNPGGQ